MHEFSLAQGLHTQLMDLVREHGMRRVRMAEIVVGRNAGVVEESFLFGVNVLVEQHGETKGVDLVVNYDDSCDLILQNVELE